MANNRDSDGVQMKKGSFKEFLEENGEAILEVAGKELVPAVQRVAPRHSGIRRHRRSGV